MRKPFSIFTAIVALSAWSGHEYVKEFFWDKVLHVLNPENSLALQYGSPIVFAGVTLYLLLRSSEKTWKEMISVALMIAGACAFGIGMLLYRGETGHLPLSEGGDSEKKVETTTKDKEETLSAFMTTTISSFYVKFNKDDVAIAVADWGSGASIILGAASSMNNNHSNVDASAVTQSLSEIMEFGIVF